jgi:DNA-binding MarR family transcriptional regulator
METQKLDQIADDMVSFIPLYHKKLMRKDNISPDMVQMKSQYPILLTLLKEDELPMSEIGKHLCISKPHMTALIDKLIEEKKVERLPDKEDRRVIKIGITKKGKDYLAECKKAAREIIKKNIKNLNDKDLLTLHESIENIKKIVSKIDEGVKQ